MNLLHYCDLIIVYFIKLLSNERIYYKVSNKI